MEESLNRRKCALVATNPNRNYIANTKARIQARNEAAEMHMEGQGGLRRGVAKTSLVAANTLDRVGAWTADAMAAGVLGGVFGGVQGSMVGFAITMGLGIFISTTALPVAAIVGGCIALFSIGGFATEYTRVKARNPEKRTAATADKLAAAGGAIDGPGFPPPRAKEPQGQVRRNPGNYAQIDEATSLARNDTERARSYAERVAPGTPPNGGNPYPPTGGNYETGTSAGGGDFSPETGYVARENLRRGLDAQAAVMADTATQVERLEQRKAAPQPTRTAPL